MQEIKTIVPNVSRETLERLEIYARLLQKWNPRINLVSKSSLDDAIRRHFVDSAQILDLAPSFSRWADLGSGGGFPGLVVAILVQDTNPETSITLIESDARKCAFLRNVSRETSLGVEVLNTRLEHINRPEYDVVSARALASLSKLLSYSESYLSKTGVCLFLKGESYATEIAEAQEAWQFEHDVFPSQSSDNGVVLRIKGAARRAA